jgi:uroporphyrinogen III methyltransferase/synthase
MNADTGTVYLVGAGPGDPGLITVRGRALLGMADVVIYDRLAHPSLLNAAPPSCVKIFAGKTSARHTLTQDEINDLLVQHAKAGRTVVRLKGGDPCVFGRGGEEAERCAAEGVPFEFVPGVTSALAAPIYAGIPVTHRDDSSSFAVITGHERNDQRESGLRRPGQSEQRRNWAHIAHAADTLIFLMGVENIREISERLQQHGRDPGTPVAMIRWGTWPQQETFVSTLGRVAEDAAAAGIKPPAVTIVGDVVRHRSALRWFDNRPLFGRRVLVTRTREQASELSQQLAALGAEPVEFPTIRIEPPLSWEPLDEALARLSSFSWTVFTSVNSVAAVRNRLLKMGRDARAFGRCRAAAVGPATAEALAGFGIAADFVPTRSISEAAVAEWPQPEMSGCSVLFPQAAAGRELLADALRRMGAEVVRTDAYQTVPETADTEDLLLQLRKRSIDAVTFASSSAVQSLVTLLGDNADLLAECRIVSIGPTTTRALIDAGFPPNAEAGEHTIAGLAAAVRTVLEGQHASV